MSSLLAADKENARCRDSGGGHTMRGEVQAGGREAGREATAAHAACRGGLDCRLGAEHAEERTLNMLSMVVTLEVSKLSGWLNADAYCREPKGGHTVWDEGQRPGRRVAAGDRRARSVQGRARL
eukprot:scaffold38703_cov47-Phaeocystis_antarctica.AAC.1